MGISRDRIRDRHPNHAGVGPGGHPYPRAVLGSVEGTTRGPMTDRRIFLEAAVAILRGPGVAHPGVDPGGKFWAVVGLMVKSAADHAARRRRIPAGWAPLLAELAALLAERPPAELGLAEEERARIERRLARIARFAPPAP
jgi:hypothetical protein